MKTKSVIRLDRLLANLGYASRSNAYRPCRAGFIALDGIPIKDPSAQVKLTDVTSGALTFKDEPFDPLAPHTIMINKPLGYSCSHKEEGALIYDLLPERWQKRNPPLSSIGRLDKESTGQLLITDDGALLHSIIAPKSNTQKHYKVTLDKPLSGSETELFASGEFMLKGEKTPLKPAQWKPETAHTGVMTLTEGRYHQIRRMFEMLGNTVTALHRFQTGALALGDLAEGQYRILKADELALLSAKPL